MSQLIRDDLLQIRTPIVNFYVLRDHRGLYLIDCGFAGGRQLLKQALQNRGWDREPIVGIIVTHGHLDHILNVGLMAQETGAWVAAPRLDSAHYNGNATYRGFTQVTGLLEAIGKPLLNFQPFTPTRLLDHGEQLDIWHGLQVVHLPGHTVGHSGFYCEQLRLLFSADLFASYGSLSHLPPRIFNSEEKLVSKSISTALDLDLEVVLPNHCDTAQPEEHYKRLVRLEENMST